MKKIRYLFVIIIGLILIFSFKNVYAGELNLNSLTFKADIRENGDMDVTEIWTIDISDTNTLFKTFRLDEDEYDGFSNATVYEVLENGQKIPFNQIYAEMYHVTKGAYYSLINSSSDYEIAWGVSIGKSTVKKYEINYTVNNIIHKYSDCAELYWQFIGSEFEIDADNIEGIITLPDNSHAKEDIRVWAHGPLNGNIYATSNNTVKFNVPKYKGLNMVEVRLAMPTDLFPLSNRSYEENKLDSIISEETEWANAANLQRKANEQMRNIVKYLSLSFAIFTIIFFIGKLKKYINILKENPKKVPEQILDYYRDIPGDKEALPTDAAFLMKRLYNIPDIISAILLDLSLRKALSFEIIEKVSSKKEINMKLLFDETQADSLKEEEKILYNYLLKASKNKNELSMKALEKYIENHSSSFNTMTDKIVQKAEKNQIQKGFFDKKEEKIAGKYQLIGALYIIICAVVSFIAFGFMTVFYDKSYIVAIASLLYFVLGIVSYKVAARFNGFTQSGVNEREKWKGLKKYIEDFSLLDEKEVPAIVLWEQYLVFATVFGIAEKALQQLRVEYPDLFDEQNMSDTSFMYLMYNNGLNKSFVSSIRDSMNSAYTNANYSSSSNYSSGSGGGRRIFWRWPEEALAAEAAEVAKVLKDKGPILLGPLSCLN